MKERIMEVASNFELGVFIFMGIIAALVVIFD